MRFTDELRIKAGDQWERVINHRFTKELAAGTIDKERVLRRYLIQDHRFLDSFVVLLSSIIANVATLNDRIPGCQFLGVITGPENNYFERAFEALQVTDEERSIDQGTPNANVTTKFCNLMRMVAKSGHLEEMLAVIVVCEWTYLSWGQIVSSGANKINMDDFTTYEWVQLHSGPEFEAVVDYLRALLDREGERLKSLAGSDDGDESNGSRANERLFACEKRFLEAVQLEEEFFDYAYAK